MRILLVEDDAILSKTTSMLLKRWHYSVKTAMTGKDALELVSHESFDLVLMDEELPDMPGKMVTRRIRAREKGTHMAIVGFSAGSRQKGDDSHLLAGMDTTIDKAIKREQLDAIVKKLKLH